VRPTFSGDVGDQADMLPKTGFEPAEADVTKKNQKSKLKMKKKTCYKIN
jgi:hypothetical protein